jgi:hypothetical protein
MVVKRLDMAAEDSGRMENIFSQLMAEFRTTIQREPSIKECRLLVGSAWVVAMIER